MMIHNGLNRTRFLFLVIFGALPTASFANDDTSSGVYVKADTGVAIMNNPTFYQIYNDEADLLTRYETKPSWAISGEIGYKFGNVRTGLQITHHSSKVGGINYVSENGAPLSEVDVTEIAEDSFTSDGLDVIQNGTTIRPKSGSFGNLGQLGIMANLTYDIPVSSVVTPYVGAGLGLTRTTMDLLDESANATRFAWQLRGGAAFQVTRSVALTADYTYRQASGGALEIEGYDGFAYRAGKRNTSLFAIGVRADL